MAWKGARLSSRARCLRHEEGRLSATDGSIASRWRRAHRLGTLLLPPVSEHCNDRPPLQISAQGTPTPGTPAPRTTALRLTTKGQYLWNHAAAPLALAGPLLTSLDKHLAPLPLTDLPQMRQLTALLLAEPSTVSLLSKEGMVSPPQPGYSGCLARRCVPSLAPAPSVGPVGPHLRDPTCGTPGCPCNDHF